MTIEAEGASGALPGGRLLNYLGSVNTPTRARRVAATGVLVSGIAYVGGGMVLWGLLGAEAVSMARTYAVSRGVAPRLMDYRLALKWTLEDAPHILVLGVMAVFGGLLLILFYRAVNRGQRIACYWCLALLYPLIFSVTISAALIGGNALFAMGLFGERRSWWAVPGLLGFVTLGLAVLLIKDLCGFLQWIADQPTAEKPRLPFI